MSRRARVGGWAVWLAAVSLVSVPVLSERGYARDGQYSGTASGSGARLTLFLPNAPASSTPIDWGGPVAQAALDSLGTSQAFASFPYPGELGVSGPGLLSGFTGVSLPTYPFYTSSDHPSQPAGDLSIGPNQLQARSAARSSEATAVLGSGNGQPGGGSTGRAKVAEEEDDKVVAASVGETNAFAAGPLTIGKVVSAATVTLESDGSRTRESSLDISGMTIDGTEVGFGPKGLTLPGAAVPFPAPAPLQAALEQAGMKLAYLDAQDTETGVIAAGLEISQGFTAPTAGSGRLSWILGQSSAGVSGNPAEQSGSDLPPLDGTVGPAPDFSEEGTTAGSPTVPGGIPVPSSRRPSPADLASGLGSSDTVVGSSTPAVPPAPDTIDVPAAARGKVQTALASRRPTTGAAGLYLVLVLAAGVALSVGSLIRLLAVRMPWTS